MPPHFDEGGRSSDPRIRDRSAALRTPRRTAIASECSGPITIYRSRSEGCATKPGACPDAVEKVLSQRACRFSKAAGAFDALHTGDHVNPGRIAWRFSYLGHEGFSCQSSLQAGVRGIFAVAVFSTFSTASTRSGHRPSARSKNRRARARRTFAAMCLMALGRAARNEISSSYYPALARRRFSRQAACANLRQWPYFAVAPSRLGLCVCEHSQ